MDTVLEMIERGKQKIEAERQAVIAQEDAEAAELEIRRLALLEDVRALFPEALRPWVSIPLGSAGDTRYLDCKYAVHIEIHVGELGLIYAMAKRYKDESLVLCNPSHISDFCEVDHMFMFLVPDIEGPEHTSMYHTYSGADDLETAMALAALEGEAFAKEQERRRLPAREPEPEPIRDPAFDLQRINDSLTDAEVMASKQGIDSPGLMVEIAQARALVSLCDRIDRMTSPAGKNGGTKLDVRVLRDELF